MPISAHLLERAYQLIDAGQLQNAELVLEAVVRVDPKNVMAWKAYLQICQEYNDLEWLMERILKSKDLCDNDKTEIYAFQNYLIQSLNRRKQSTDEGGPKRVYKVASPAQEDVVIFELLDEFEYPIRKTEQARRRKPRQLYKFSIPPYVWQAAALLVLFYTSVRMLVLGYLFGYLLIGVFVVGGVYWIRSINAHKPINSIDVTHAYSLESENELFIIDKPNANAKIDKNKDLAPRIRYLDE